MPKKDENIIHVSYIQFRLSSRIECKNKNYEDNKMK